MALSVILLDLILFILCLFCVFEAHKSSISSLMLTSSLSSSEHVKKLYEIPLLRASNPKNRQTEIQ